MIAGALDYCRTRLNSLGYTEWTDSFNFDNIPRTLLDSRYHLTLNTTSRKVQDHDNIELNVPITIRLSSRAFTDTGAGRDAAIIQADTIIEDFILASNSLNDSVIRIIQFDNLNLEQLNDTNDNVITLVLDFTALVVKSTR